MKAPERIWLQPHDNPNDYFDWTWSIDQIEEDEVEYVRADVVAKLVAETVDEILDEGMDAALMRDSYADD